MQRKSHELTRRINKEKAENICNGKREVGELIHVSVSILRPNCAERSLTITITIYKPQSR